MPKYWLMPVVLVAAAAVHADERAFTFECDAPPGHYSNWTMTTQAKAVTITGTLRVNEIRLEKKKTAAASVYIKGGADNKSAWGFRAFDPQKNKKLFLKVSKPGGHDDLGTEPLDTGRKIPFRLELTPSGTLKAKVGDLEHSAEFGPVKPTRIDFSCSTGDFSFADLRVVETN